MPRAAQKFRIPPGAAGGIDASAWRRLARLVTDPRAALPAAPAELDALLDRLRWEGVGAVVARRRLEAGGTLTEPQRRALSREADRHKAAFAATMLAFERLLGLLAAGGHAPVLLKGLHLAHCYYEAPHLRPMSDMDLLFPDLAEAEEVQRVLAGHGFTSPYPVSSGSPWDAQYHLPTLRDPQNGALVEIHGSLIFAPRDRRWRAMRPLLEGLEEIPGLPGRCFGLAPEANVVFLLAHMFEQHSAEPPRLVALADVAAVAEKTGPAFGWERLGALAAGCGCAVPVARGLALAREYLGLPVPEPLLERLEQAAGDDLPYTLETRSANIALQKLGNARNPLVALRMGLQLLAPPPAHLRQKYGERRHWPVALLYPYRWADQARQLVRFFFRRPEKGRSAPFSPADEARAGLAARVTGEEP